MLKKYRHFSPPLPFGLEKRTLPFHVILYRNSHNFLFSSHVFVAMQFFFLFLLVVVVYKKMQIFLFPLYLVVCRESISGLRFSFPFICASYKQKKTQNAFSVYVTAYVEHILFFFETYLWWEQLDLLRSMLQSPYLIQVDIFLWWNFTSFIDGCSYFPHIHQMGRYTEKYMTQLESIYRSKHLVHAHNFQI